MDYLNLFLQTEVTHCNYNEISFQDRFRMQKVYSMEISSLLEHRLSSLTQRGQPVPVCLLVLITLVYGIWHLSPNWGFMWCQWINNM